MLVEFQMYTYLLGVLKFKRTNINQAMSDNATGGIDIRSPVIVLMRFTFIDYVDNCDDCTPTLLQHLLTRIHVICMKLSAGS